MGSRYSTLYALILLSMNVYSHVVPAAMCECSDMDQSAEENCAECQASLWYCGAVEGTQRARSGRGTH